MDDDAPMTPHAIAPSADWRLAVVLAVLLAIAAVTAWLGRLDVQRDQVVAGVRAVAQLAVVAVVIVGVLRSVWLSVGFALLMYAVAVFTAWRRLAAARASARWVAGAIAAGAGPVVGLCLASGVVPLTGAALIPVAGIVTGNAMTAVTLSGRRALRELTDHHDLYEAALALGLPERVSRDLVVRPTAREALLPAIDQTRTVGLVTLPGAFVGVLLGGGTPVQAASAQILVLIGVIAAQALTAAVVLWAVTTGRIRRPSPRLERDQARRRWRVFG